MTHRIAQLAGIAALSALFAGCAGNAATPNAAASGASRLGRSTLVARGAHAAHPDRSTSWMRREATSSDLLYVSDVGTEDVYVYTYPGGMLAGTLTGFAEPQGLCSDVKGDVWVVDTQKSRLLEYAHGGTTPIAVLADHGEYPSGCAVDAKGNVAATNIATTHGGPGSVALYAGGTGKPNIITSSSFAELYFADFDRNGNLFVDGFPPNFAQAALGEVRHGTAALVNVPVNGATLEFPGGVQVRGTTVNVGDQIEDAVFQIEENGTVAGIVPLNGAADCVQGTILRATFVCPDGVNSALEFFRYPAGGSPKRAIKGLIEPTGTAISLSP